ncbi:cupin domain-containing protein [Brachybacterium halotolerans subsp. kimchii]|uniref:cupin domain-containing protein n=1 Tax=Brachybacterium halotolerans TaxID=2795215 RepID=UPI001E582156|nr:cupin domain-containing protein [Brachybacterium halotolerans]UEJ83838.1 cupin domain-containing protein [Brachybacterium halotolerans subsp. kimchii]
MNASDPATDPASGSSPVTSLELLADELLDAAASAHSGRAGRPFHGIDAHADGGAAHGAGRPGVLTQIVLALTEGSRLSDHENPGEATLQTLRGRVRVRAGERTFELSAGELLVIPQERHDLVALEDAVVILTIARHAVAGQEKRA